jgi:peptidoglycan/xylan/chitin deacetylase (PgdA/CDA1 family)
VSRDAPSHIPILVYHQIDAAPAKGAPFRSLYVSPAAFARQMAWLKFWGYTGLSMPALVPYLNGGKRGKVVGITFDDGYLNNLQYAMPVLQRHGFSSTCYAVSDLVGKTNQWDADIGIAQTPLMDAAQLRQWHAGGQDVGAHTRHHVHLSAQDDALSVDQIARSKTVLEEAVQAPVAHFCYPYGDYQPRHTTMAREAGYATATTTQRGRSTAANDAFQLPRVAVLRSTTLAQFALKLWTPYEDFRGGPARQAPSCEVAYG